MATSTLTSNGGELNPSTVTAQAQQPAALTRRNSTTLDNILNGKRTFTPDARTRDAMNAWGLNHFVPDSRLTGDTPRDAMNRWNIQHGNVARQPVTQSQQAQQQSAQDQPTTLTGMLDVLRGQQEEEDAAEKKKQQRDLNIKSLGDMFNALSNLYFTTQYAPSWYSDKSSMTDRQRERYDRLNAARDANNQAYLNMYLNQADKERQQKNADRAFQFQKENADREAELQRDKFEYQQTKDDADRDAAAKRQADQNEWQSGENEKNRNATAANQAAQIAGQLEIAGLKGGGSGGFHQTKPVQLSNAKGGDEKNQFQIDPNIWNYAAPMLARTLAEELHYTPDSVNPKSDEEFLLENWSKSDNVTRMLHELSKADPKNFQSIYNRLTAPPAVNQGYEPMTDKAKRKVNNAKKADKKAGYGTPYTPDPNRQTVNAG